MTKAVCLIPDCERVGLIRGLCKPCYRRALRLIRAGEITWEIVHKGEMSKADNYTRKKATVDPKKLTDHLAVARCQACNEQFASHRGGEYVECGCGKSFVDQERWSAAYVRLGGEAILLQQFCPPGCVQKEHNKDRYKGQGKSVRASK